MKSHIIFVLTALVLTLILVSVQFTLYTHGFMYTSMTESTIWLAGLVQFILIYLVLYIDDTTKPMR